MPVLGELHRGGQGVVYRAVQLSTKRNVAIKFLLDGMLAGASNKRRFEREVELAGSLRHPGIVSVFDSGLANGQYYFVMDLIEGRPLDRFVREENLPARSTLELLVGICEAVDYAHQRGVIHRDLKPSNILVDEDHHPYILDFGLATTADQDLRETLSSSGQIMGTLAYMSPEHAVGRPIEVDLRSDVYSLGVVAYQLLTQSLPYPLNRSFLDDLEAIRTREPDREALKSSRVDDEMSTILLKSLDKNKIRRYPTAGAMGDDIARYLCGEPIEAKRDSAWYVLQKTVKRHRTPFAVAASFLALLLVASVVSTLLFLDARKTSEQLRQTLYFSEMSFAGQQMHRPGGIGRIRELVSHWKTDDQGADLRGWEWYRLRAFCNRERLILRGHRADVWSVDWSPDGSQIASSSTADATLNLWDSVSGEKSATIQTSAGRWVRFSPQGDRLALCSFRGDVIIWDLHANEKRFELMGHQDRSTVRCVDWRPDGKQLASCSNGGEIVIWDAIDGSLLRSLDLGSGRVASVSWNPEGTQLVAAAASRVIVLDAATGTTVWENDGWLGDVQSARWSPCGTMIAAAAQNEILRILESSSGEVRAELNADPSGSIWCLDWSPNSQQIVTAHKDRTVRIWDADELTLLQSLHGSDQQPLCVRWSPDGSQIVSAGADYAVRVWDVRTQDRTAQINSSHDYITSIAWDSSGTRIVSSGGDRMLQIWHLDRTERPLVLDTSQDPVGKTGSVTAVRWSPDDRYLATAGHDHTVRIWDASTGQLLRKMMGHELRSLCLAWHPDGIRLASGGGDQSVRIWDTQTGEQQCAIATGDLVTQLQWSPDGNFLAFADTGHQEYVVSIRSSADYAQERRLPGAGQSILALCWSPDGSKIAAGGQDSTARVWDVATAKQITPALQHGGAVKSIDWLRTKDDARLACATNSGEVCVWDVDSGRLALSFETPRLTVPEIAWSPDGRCLAAASGPFLCIWDAYPGVADPRYSERRTSE